MTTSLIPARIVHLHVTRKCNLTCNHCYSNSSPTASESLAVAPTIDAIEMLRQEQYDTIAFSGGEPFLHPELSQIAEAAKELGYKISAISNGVSINDRILDTMKSTFDSIAISFDGTETVHNEIRGRNDSFQRALRTLDALAEQGIPFALSCTASHGNLEDVVELYEIGREKGAVAMQVSPIVAVGRGEKTDKYALDENEKARLLFMGRVLDRCPEGPRVRVELQSQSLFQKARSQFGILHEGSDIYSLSDLINPLVIDETGSLQPFAYGLDSRYSIAKLGRGMEFDVRLWRQSGLQDLRQLVERSFIDKSVTEQTFVEWYADIVRLSKEYVDVQSPKTCLAVH